MSRNPYATAKPYTRWSIRRLSVGVASVVVASGFFILASNPTVHADQLSEPTSAVSVSPVETASALAENMKTEPTSTTENTSEVDQVASATSEVAVKEDGLNTVDQAPTVRVESSNKEGKLDESLPQAETVSIPVGEDRVAQPVPEKMEEIQTTPAQVQESVAENVKESTDVPASYLEKANVPGPFLAGVNQVIPYEAFGGDGMLTRLLLKASDKAPWSDNGVAKNPALLPLEKLGNGQYFYEVDLNGNTTGKDGQALLDQLRMNGTQAYMATVKVYGAKDGKADLTNLVASREVVINFHGMTVSMGQNPMSNHMPMHDQHHMSDKHSDMTMMQSHQEQSQESPSMNMPTSMKADHPAEKGMMAQSEKMMAKMEKMTLPNTGEASSHLAGIGVVGLVVAGILSTLGIAKKDSKKQG